MFRTKIAVIVMAALLVVYLVAVSQRAIVLLQTPGWVPKLLGLALFALPLLGVYALAVEVRFGLSSQRLARRLEDERALPEVDDVAGEGHDARRTRADSQFLRCRDDVQQDPESWRCWFRLGLAYDACGDRTRARRAIRRAIALESSRVAD